MAPEQLEFRRHLVVPFAEGPTTMGTTTSYTAATTPVKKGRIDLHDCWSTFLIYLSVVLIYLSVMFVIVDV